nr:hypothetical protein [uncultured Schaedlerella sp.]
MNKNKLRSSGECRRHGFVNTIVCRKAASGRLSVWERLNGLYDTFWILERESRIHTWN